MTTCSLAIHADGPINPYILYALVLELAGPTVAVQIGPDAIIYLHKPEQIDELLNVLFEAKQRYYQLSAPVAAPAVELEDASK